MLIVILTLSLITCNYKKSNFDQGDITAMSELQVKSSKIDYKYYDVFNIAPAKVIVPKNQTIAQGLSVLVNDGHGNLIVFDGGRVEDADYLCDIIKDNGGVVKTWFVTHIHDDHIGALYKILSDKRTDIVIEKLYYDFASFDWYYIKMGNDAGIYTLFINIINEYNKYLKSKDRVEIEVIDNVNYKDFDRLNTFTYYKDDTQKSKMSVSVLNNHYELDQDPINNTSIVYVVNIENTQMFIFGDLGYEGGNKLFSESIVLDKNKSHNIYLPKGNTSLESEVKENGILVLAHHGQNGIAPYLYKNFNPKVVVWPTSKDIFENTHGTYYTNDTKIVLSEIKSIEYQIKSYEETAVIK